MSKITSDEIAVDFRGTVETDDRRLALLDAAARAFSSFGYRRTSLEDVAHEAGISRSAIYLHVRNKEDLFRSLSEHHHALALQKFRAALAQDGPVAEVLQAALIARDEDMFAIVHGSPHGEEIIDANFRTGADIVQAYGDTVQNLLADWIVDQGYEASEAARRTAIALLNAAHGQKAGADTIMVYQSRLGIVSRAFATLFVNSGKRA